mgnify:FL=1
MSASLLMNQAVYASGEIAGETLSGEVQSAEVQEEIINSSETLPKISQDLSEAENEAETEGAETETETTDSEAESKEEVSQKEEESRDERNQDETSDENSKEEALGESQETGNTIQGEQQATLAGPKKTGWVTENGKEYYYDEEGKPYTKSRILDLNGTLYYINSNGELRTQVGWVKDGANWYYVTSQKALAKNGWIKSGSNWFYLNSDGVMQTGMITVYGKKYILQESGAMLKKTGWVQYQGNRYYMYSDGHVFHGGWLKVSNKWYYMDTETGMMKKGWLKTSGKYYYLNSSGVMQTGWQKIDGAWYYFGNEKNGAMQVGWQIVDHEYYYIVDSGVMQTYWRKIDGNYYFFGANGVRRTGWQKIWGKWYYLDENGVMQTGWQKIKGVWYYFGGASDGSMKTGWQTIHGKTYYFDSEGAMAVGTVTIGGTKYEFNSSGALKEETKNEGLYQITGTSSVTVSQMVKYYNTYSSIAYPSAALTKGGAADIETFCKIIKEEADAENMKADVVFIQAMLETGYLKFGGDVKISQFNFAGLGATGNGVAGNSFKDVRTGIRAQVQHLKAYANKEALKNTCVDVRFFYVTRGSAPYVEWLGIQENPNGGGWAASKNYGNDLLGLINKLKAI